MREDVKREEEAESGEGRGDRGLECWGVDCQRGEEAGVTGVE